MPVFVLCSPSCRLRKNSLTAGVPILSDYREHVGRLGGIIYPDGEFPPTDKFDGDDIDLCDQ